MRHPLSRREFLSTSVAAATAAAVGLPDFSLADAAGALDPMSGWKWDKGVCRFCGVGCGIQIATQDERVVAVQGRRRDSPVNRGLLCVKGYANAEIPYGADRLTHPLLRMKDGKFDKSGDFVPVSWERAFDEMERAVASAPTANSARPASPSWAPGSTRSRRATPRSKLVKAGWRSNNLDPNARHCMASAVAAFMQTFGIDEPSGCYDDIELTDTVVLWGANMAEMHPMLWARIVDQRLRRPELPRRQPDHLPQPLARSSRTSRSSSSPTPTSRSGTTSPARSSQRGAVDQDVRRQALRLRHRPDRHRLRHAAGATSSPSPPRRTPRRASRRSS